MFTPLVLTFLAGFLIIWFSNKKKKPYDQFPMDNDDVDNWRNLNN
jgi:hypothetical protein